MKIFIFHHLIHALGIMITAPDYIRLISPILNLLLGQIGALQAAIQLNLTPVKLVIICYYYIKRSCQFELINEYYYFIYLLNKSKVCFKLWFLLTFYSQSFQQL